MRLQNDTPLEDVLELANDERLRQEEFDRVNRVLEQFPVVQEIVLHESAQRARLQLAPPSPIDALTNTRLSYPEVIPILVQLLCQVKHPDVKMAIARALTVKEARGIATPVC